MLASQAPPHSMRDSVEGLILAAFAASRTFSPRALRLRLEAVWSVPIGTH